ncbi:hypothetical protein NXV03_07410 [Phocaeicola vulgatus]|nr:hypothetical protein [Phocaeicola vulgatus]
MKLKSIKKKIWSIVIIITTLIGILPVQANTTETPVKDVELDGRWDDPIRSACYQLPHNCIYRWLSPYPQERVTRP